MTIGFFFLCIMPESPRFLISTNKFVEAREVFAWIGKVNGLSPDEIEKKMNQISFEGENYVVKTQHSLIESGGITERVVDAKTIDTEVR